MGKDGWFSALKKVLNPEPKEKKDQKIQNSKRWFGKHKSADSITLPEEASDAAPAPTQSIDDKKFVQEENVGSKHACSVAALASAAAAAQAVAEVVRPTTMPLYYGKSNAEIAAIKIQTSFRGYLARKALRALRGLVRLKTFIEAQSVKRQAASTLRCMQMLVRMQSQIRERRIRMSEENQAIQRQLQQKHEKELDKLRMAEVWDDSLQSKKQIEANLQNKQEAAMRRERALAYAFSHQTRKNSHSHYPRLTFMDPNNPQWGWSWLERWMADRPCEIRSMKDQKELNDHSNHEMKPSLSRDFPSSSSKRASSTPIPFSRKLLGDAKAHAWATTDDDSKSSMSVQSERYKRNSVAGSSVRDDESLASSPAIPSYMAPTWSQSAKFKSKVPSPLGGGIEKDGTPEKGSTESVKKRLLFLPGQRRHSVPGMNEWRAGR